jgi:hypothetical protein
MNVYNTYQYNILQYDLIVKTDCSKAITKFEEKKTSNDSSRKNSCNSSNICFFHEFFCKQIVHLISNLSLVQECFS